MQQADILKSLAKKSDEHEFYTPIPKNYKPGKTKYVVVFGTVMSGLGKGIFSSSLAKLMQDKGLKVSPIKFDGYLNVDAGTLNPFRHGEVFVLDDGTECDMDLGNYERFLDKSMTSDNYLTGGKIFTNILFLEREGKFLGRDVQFIPHVTGEIKNFVRELAVKTDADLVFIEVGGTVGDIENMYFIEAMRELAYEEGLHSTCFIALTYILQPEFLGEQKSKAAQLGIRSLLGAGVQPDIISCRASKPVTEKVREKISIYSNVPFDRVISVHDLESIYILPLLLKESKVDEALTDILKIKKSETEKEKLNEWENFVEKIKKPKSEVTIGITGKYTEIRDSYASVIEALKHSGAYLETKINIKWIETTAINNEEEAKEMLKGISGIIVPGGFGKRGAEGKIACIEYIRKNNIPYLGLCFGFQMAVIEFARNVCGIKDANSTELEETKNPVIDMLPEQKKIEGLGGNMRLGSKEVDVREGTIAHKLYGSVKINERFRHRYEVNPKYIGILEKNGMVFSGKAPQHPIMQILELPNHPYFIATQYHGEFKSRPLVPHPLFKGLVEAALKR